MRLLKKIFEYTKQGKNAAIHWCAILMIQIESKILVAFFPLFLVSFRVTN